MDARGDQAERGTSAAIGIRFGVHVRASVDQQVCDLDDVVWRFLSEVFDSVCGDVMQKRGMMLAGGALVHQVRVILQEFAESGYVAGDDCVGCGFEIRAEVGPK
jgi:hypothetical protein